MLVTRSLSSVRSGTGCQTRVVHLIRQRGQGLCTTRIWAAVEGSQGTKRCMHVVLPYLGFKVNISRGHFGDLEDADGQRDGTQYKQAIVDQDAGQDCMSDSSITRNSQGQADRSIRPRAKSQRRL